MKNGDRIEKYGNNFVVLDNEFKTADGKVGTLLLMANILDIQSFDEQGSNFYPESTICQYLKNTTQKLIGDEETGTIELSMVAEDGTGWENEPYRTDGLFLLTADMYRKYRRYIPKMSNWWWLATAYSFFGSKYSGGSHFVQVVNNDSTLDNHHAYYGILGVVPALIIPN